MRLRYQEIPIDIVGTGNDKFDKDFLVIASSADSLLPILKSALDLNTKIFIEKPVTSKSDNLKDIKYKKNIQVGLNRRFYPNFQYFKSKINTCNSCGSISLGFSETCMNCGAKQENISNKNQFNKKPSESTIEVKAEEIK